jgi:hypothetical protein
MAYWNGDEPEPVKPHPVYQGGPCPECGAPRGHQNPWCYSYDLT